VESHFIKRPIRRIYVEFNEWSLSYDFDFLLEGDGSCDESSNRSGPREITSGGKLDPGDWIVEY
jgi:hypothetical protein